MGVAFLDRAEVPEVRAIRAAAAKLEEERPGTFVIAGMQRGGEFAVPTEYGAPMRLPVADTFAAVSEHLVPWSQVQRVVVVACYLTDPIMGELRRFAPPGVEVEARFLHDQVHVHHDGSIVSGETPWPVAPAVSLHPDSAPGAAGPPVRRTVEWTEHGEREVASAMEAVKRVIEEEGADVTQGEVIARLRNFPAESVVAAWHRVHGTVPHGTSGAEGPTRFGAGRVARKLGGDRP